MTTLPAITILLALTIGSAAGSTDTTINHPAPDTAITTSASEQVKQVSPQKPHDKKHQRQLLVVRETADTVFVIDRSAIHHLLKNWRRNITHLRQRSIGLSGSSNYGAYAISAAPVKELVRKTPYFTNTNFHFSRFGYEPFITFGGAGCIGLGDGFRIGGGGMSGQCYIDGYRGSNEPLRLGMKVDYGGFMVEKTMVLDRWNFTAGGTIGGGTLKVTVTEKNNNSYFINDNDDYVDFDQIYADGNSTEAGFFLFEPHGSASYTFFHFFHIGLTVSVPTFISIEKFNIYTDDFFTVNPGFHFRLIFGNLG